MASDRSSDCEAWTLQTDGSSKGNPGRAGAAFLLSRGEEVASAGKKHLGITTNNVAEYEAVIMGLEEALRLGVKNLTLVTDSRLVANQILGTYRVHKEHLRPLNQRCRQLVKKLEQFRVKLVSSHQNRAHNLAEAAAEET